MRATSNQIPIQRFNEHEIIAAHKEKVDSGYRTIVAPRKCIDERVYSKVIWKCVVER